MSRFLDKVVFVTDGTSGLGAATCQLFINEGARVFVTDEIRVNVICPGLMDTPMVNHLTKEAAVVQKTRIPFLWVDLLIRRR
ncbi:uncharacterized protein A1O9_06378 [Exophiala aquamarina CBS 119918]|uniref:Uncharacterized protein n=1 Tax=Exophiala aquamarina CBS 119918 TaxID=1182545 RepID=A0A072PFA6_9EURO|nr:uncharacterized protein A1O9_06378 [Exophiala aquamarina CBS 119918]KEF58452.1 hypothetical protein A1O9_06378 [Exophiala aquamarina CBS 119918]